MPAVRGDTEPAGAGADGCRPLRPEDLVRVHFRLEERKPTEQRDTRVPSWTQRGDGGGGGVGGCVGVLLCHAIALPCNRSASTQRSTSDQPVRLPSSWPSSVPTRYFAFCVRSHLSNMVPGSCWRPQMSYDSLNLTTPDIKWLGVRPSDLDRYNIPDQCRLDMTASDIATGKSMLQEDFILQNPQVRCSAPPVLSPPTAIWKRFNVPQPSAAVVGARVENDGAGVIVTMQLPQHRCRCSCFLQCLCVAADQAKGRDSGPELFRLPILDTGLFATEACQR